METDWSYFCEHGTQKSLKSILEEIYSALDNIDALNELPPPKVKNISDIRALALEYFSHPTTTTKIIANTQPAPKKIWTAEAIEMREIESNNIVKYLESIEPIVNQLNLSSADKRRIVYHLVTAKGSTFVVNLLARMEGIKAFIETRSIKTEDLVSLSDCTLTDNLNRFLTKCSTISTYNQNTGVVTVHCQSRRQKGRYKQIIGKINKVLKFKKIELVVSD